MASSICGRALHHVCRVGNRAKTMDFYRNILGMKVNKTFNYIVSLKVAEIFTDKIKSSLLSTREQLDREIYFA